MAERMRRVVLRQAGLKLLVAAVVLTGLSCGGESLAPPTTGNLEITTATTGSEPDADGYLLTIDGGTEMPLGTNATMRRDALEAGNHTVRLTGMAPNCTVAGENPRTVSIPAGETTTVSFQLTCSATTGSLKVTTSTSGPSPDPDGYTVTLDGSDRGTVGPTAEVTADGVAPGDHQVGLSGIAANCQAQGNPRAVTVTAGATATSAFVITCVTPPATTGSLKITTTTTGPNPDPDGYGFTLDGGASQSIGLNATTTLANVAAGTHTVTLSGMAANCSVQGTHPRSVTVTGAGTSNVSFTIACTATTGSLEITTTTTGANLDPDGYTVSVDRGPAQAIAINATLAIPNMAPGEHSVALAGVASNCTAEGTNPRAVAVTAGNKVPVGFTVTCTTAGVNRWTTIPLPSGLVGTALWASSPSDVFVAALDRSAFASFLLHYDGHVWTKQLDEPVHAVWGSSPTEVFAVGGNMVWHYDGTRWSPFYEGTTDADALGYHAIWGTSPRDLFVAGSLGYAAGSPQSIGFITHYDGVTWSGYAPDPSNYVDIYDFGGSSATDVYAVARETCSCVDEEEVEYVNDLIVHNDGTGWIVSYNTLIQPAETADYRTGLLTGVWANARNDVFVVGWGGRILHFNGTAWSPMTSPTSENLDDIWGNSGSNVYAVGDAGILHYNGTRWSVINAAKGSRVWGVGDDVFVVSEGSILHGTP